MEFDLVGFIIAFEGGDLDEEAIVDGFQHLINSGTVWQLQGHYGRTAARLIELGRCTRPGPVTDPAVSEHIRKQSFPCRGDSCSD